MACRSRDRPKELRMTEPCNEPEGLFTCTTSDLDPLVRARLGMAVNKLPAIPKSPHPSYYQPSLA